jgi:hypothetical protein
MLSDLGFRVDQKSESKGGAWRRNLAPPIISLPQLEGVSETEIGLNEVVGSPVNEVITSFTEERDMRSEPVFESTTEVGEHPIFSNIVT